MLQLAKVLWWCFALLALGGAAVVFAFAFTLNELEARLICVGVSVALVFWGIVPFTCIAVLDLLDKQTRTLSDILSAVRYGGIKL